VQHTAMKMTRKKKILIGIGVFLAVFFVGGYIFSKTAFFTDKVRLTMESVLRKQLKREVSVGKVSGNIYGGMKIANISIAKDEKLSEGKLAEIELLEANYSLLSLLRWKFNIKSVKIERPRIWIVRYEDGKLNLPEFGDSNESKDDGKKSRFRVLVSAAEIISGEVTFDDKVTDIHSVIHEINGELTGSSRELEYSGKIRAQEIEIDVQGTSKNIFNIASSFEIWEEGAALSDLQLQLGKSRLTAKGRVINGASPQVSGELRSTLFLEDVSDFLPVAADAQPMQLEGAAEIYGMVSGTIPELAGIITMSLPTMRVNDLEIRDVDTELRFTQDSFTLTKMSANLPEGNAEAEGIVRLSDGKVSGYNGALNLDRLNISEIITAINRSDSPVSGLLSGEVLMSGTEFRPGSVNLDAQLSMTDTKLKNPASSTRTTAPETFPIGTIKALLGVKGDSIALKVSRGGTDLELDGKLGDSGDLDLSVEIDKIDLGEITTLLNGTPSVIGGGRVSAVASMKIVNSAFRSSMGLPPLDSELAANPLLPPDTIADIRCRLNVDMPDLRLPIPAEESQDGETVQIGSLTGLINLVDDRLRVDEIALKLGESELLVTAEVQLKDSPLIDARLTVNSLRVEDYTRLIGSTQDQPAQISGGLVNGELAARGELADMNGRGDLSVTALSVGGRDIELIRVPIWIESSALRIPNLVVSSLGDQIRLACGINQSGDYDLQVISSPIDLSKLVASDLPVAGTAQLFVSGSGNLKSPSLNGKLELTNLGYNGEVFGSGECVFALTDKDAHVDVSLSERTIIATLDAGIQYPFPFSGIVQLGNINLEPALKLAGVDEKIDLHITGSIDLDGEGANLAVADNAPPLRVDARLQGVALDVEGYRWVNDAPMMLSFKDGKLRADSLKMKGAGGEISVSGEFDIAGAIDMDVDARKFDLAIISEVADLPKPVSGRIDCKLEMDGDIGSPIIAIRADGSRLAYDKLDAGSFSANFSYKEGLMELEELVFSAFEGRARLRASLPIDLDLRNLPTPDQLIESSVNASLDAEDINLNFIAKLVPQLSASGGELSDANLKVTGKITQPKIDGSLSLRNVYFRSESLPVPIDNINGKLSIQNVNSKTGMGYRASLDIGWDIEKGKYDAQGEITVPYWVLAAEYSALSGKNPESGTADKKMPEFEFDLDIQNGQLGSLVREMAKDLPVPIAGNFSGKVHLDSAIPYEALHGSPLAILDNLRGTVIISSLDMAVNDHKIKNREWIDISFANRELSISDMEFLTLAPPTGDVGATSIQVGSIRASGKVNLDQVFNVNLSVKSLHLGLFSSLMEPPMNLTGKLGIDMSASGKFDAPVIALNLLAEDMSIPVPSPNAATRETRIEKILCRVSYRNEILSVEEAYIDSFGNRMDASGTLPVRLSLMPPVGEILERRMDLKMFTDNFDLAFLSPLIDEVEEVKGLIKADVRMFGSFKNPRLIGKLQLSDASCRLLIDNSALAQAEIAGADIPPKQPLEVKNIGLSISMEDGKITMDKTAFQIGDGQYDIHGELGIGYGLKPQLFDVNFRAFPAKLDPFLQLAGPDLASRASGEITVDGSLSGDFRDLMGKPVLDMLKAISGEMSILAEGINIRAEDHLITNPNQIYANLENGNLDLRSFKLIDKTPGGERTSSVAAHGNWQIGGEKMFDATINLDMGLVSELTRQPELMSGWLGFKVEGRGKMMTCKWPLPNETFGQQKFTVGHASMDRFEGTVIYQDQEIRVEQGGISSGDNHIFFSGNVPMTGKSMNLRVDGRLDDMSILSFVGRDITESSGKGVIAATLTGDAKKIMAKEEPVRFAGFCRFEDLDVYFDKASIKFEDLKAEIEFDSASVSPEKGLITAKVLRGKINDGDFVLTADKQPGAEILWDKDKGFRLGDLRNISIAIKDCTLDQPMVYSVLFDGELALIGKFDSPIIRGNVVIAEASYIESMESLVQKLFSSRDIGVKAFLDYPLVQDLELDLDVQAPGNVWVDNSLAKVETAVAAKVRGSLAKPVVLAQANIIKGSKILYLGREFNITSGEIKNESEINPSYDIAAETELEDFGDEQDTKTMVYMEMKGSLSEFQPPTFTVPGEDLSQTDIISILTLGSTPEEFKELLTSASSSSISPLLMKPAKWYLESQAEKLLKMKEFQIQIDPGGSEETRLVMAKKLMADISVLLDVGYSGQRLGIQRVGLQYDVSKHFAIAGELEEGDWGLDLKIKHDFP